MNEPIIYPFTAIREAVIQSRQLNRAVEQNAYAMGSLLKGKLRYCSRSDLVAMKKELSEFNMNTGKWKTK
jgi:hypothetical protein